MAIAALTKGSGPALVLLHGVGTHSGIWHRVLPELARERTVIALDLPGFGRSEPLGPGFDLATVADALEEAARDHAGGRFELIGHSLGGAIATLIASRHPGSVERLILAAPAGFSSLPGPAAWLAGSVGAQIVRARRALGERFVGSATGRRVLFTGTLADGSRISPEDARLMLDASADAARFAEAVTAVAGAELRPALAAVRSPVDLIWGERDPLIKPALAQQLIEIRPEARLETISRAGHIPQIENPPGYVEAVRALVSTRAD